MHCYILLGSFVCGLSHSLAPQWVGCEPTAEKPDTFALKMPGGGGHGGDDGEPVVLVERTPPLYLPICLSTYPSIYCFSPPPPSFFQNQAPWEAGVVARDHCVQPQYAPHSVFACSLSVPVCGYRAEEEEERDAPEEKEEREAASKEAGFSHPLMSPMSIGTDESGAGGSGASRGGHTAAAAVSHEPHPVPYNPFLHTGALVVASLVGRGHAKKTNRLFHDSGSRFTHLHERVKDMAGGLPIGFNKPLFLALKQRGRKVCVCVRACVCV